MSSNEKTLEVVWTKLGDRFSLKFDYDDELRKIIKTQDRTFLIEIIRNGLCLIRHVKKYLIT